MSDLPQTIREANMAYLNEHGFQPATWLPLLPAAGEASEPGDFGGVLRPAEEIAHRYLALFGVFAWGSAPPQMEGAIADFIERNDLRSAMAEDELAIVDLPKEQAMEEFQGTVGWRLENMWSLAWILGFVPEPSATSGQLSDDITGPMISQFLPDFSPTVDSLLEAAQIQSEADVVRLHDLFYCAHNAVRSAQLGHDTVPEDFDPLAAGGAIHERRHSLSWALAPGTTWDHTPLDT